MSRVKLLAGNWKMNKSLGELPAFFSDFVKHAEFLSDILGKVDLLFAVPFTLLEAVHRFGQMHGFKVAAQNVHWEASGAFTGEVSLAQLADLKVHTVLVGHSERRQFFAETDATVAKKVSACLDRKAMPIACIGESRAEREGNQTEAVVARQMQAIIDAKKGRDGKIVIAYEPVWAIGTGLSATAEQADEVHLFIRNIWKNSFGVGAAEELTILYGGSANGANAATLFAKENIDGALVGGASLKPDEFAQMLKALVAPAGG